MEHVQPVAKQKLSERKKSFRILVVILIPLFGYLAFQALLERAAQVRAHAEAEGRVAALFQMPIVSSPLSRLETSFASYEQSATDEATPEERLAKSNARKDLCIAAMVEGEAGNEPLDGQYMAAYVGHMRASDGWFKSHDPCVQVCKTGKGRHREFDGTKQFCSKFEPALKSGGQLPTVPEKFLAIAREVRSGAYKPPEECRNARYFINPRFSSPGGIKYFAQQLKFRCVKGDHLFAEERPAPRKLVARVMHKPQNKKYAAR